MVEQSNNVAASPDGVIGVRTISNKHQIYSILASVQKARAPITIKFENQERYYTSLILRTELDEGYIIIDEIAPQDGHLLAMQKRPFSIRGNHNGVSLFFRPNTIAGSGIESDISFYKIPLPREMIYQQRRSAFRALVARALNIQAKITSARDQQLYSGRLFDLSISGCRVNFEGEIKPQWVRGDLFESSDILLGNGLTIRCPLKLKHSEYIRDWNETTCGFQFQVMDNTSKKEIDRYVYFLQREARRLETK